MNRLSLRLTLAFLLLTWLAIGAVALILRNAIEGGFREYVQRQDAATIPEALPDNLIAYYNENESWAGAESRFPGRGNAEGRGNNQGKQYFVVDLAGAILVSSDPARLSELIRADALQNAIPLRQNGQQIGWLAWQTPGQQRFGEAEEAFLDDMTRALLVIGGAAGVLALVFGSALAWGLMRPLGHLTQAVQQLSVGQRGQQVTPEGTKEIRDLAAAFNEMSAALARSESARQRMAADVAHELRTPVTVLSGHLEGMLDDVLSASKEQIAVAYDQTLHLKRLIEDLRLLTLAEVKQLPLKIHPLDPVAFLKGIYAAFEPLALDQRIQLVQDIPADLPPLPVDEGRLRQVFGNLLTNALRHTPAGGTISIKASVQNKLLVFRVGNTGATLAPEDAAHLFDPFWRAEEARNRDSGGSGLGLAIAKSLIELHAGMIRVEMTHAETIFIIELPWAGRLVPMSANRQ